MKQLGHWSPNGPCVPFHRLNECNVYDQYSGNKYSCSENITETFWPFDAARWGIPGSIGASAYDLTIQDPSAANGRVAYTETYDQVDQGVVSSSVCSARCVQSWKSERMADPPEKRQNVHPNHSVSRNQTYLEPRLINRFAKRKIPQSLYHRVLLLHHKRSIAISKYFTSSSYYTTTSLAVAS